MPDRSASEFRELVGRLLALANRGSSMVEFLEGTTDLLLRASGGTAIVIRLESWGRGVRCRAIRSVPARFRFETERSARSAAPDEDDAGRARLCRALLAGRTGRGGPFTPRGGFRCADAAACEPVDLGPVDGIVDVRRWAALGGFRSLALLPITNASRPIGLLQFIADRPDVFEHDDIAFLEDVAGVLGQAVECHRAQWALSERIKELTCLYGIARLAEDDESALPELLPRVAALLPPGWQFPDVCAARIVLDGHEYATGRVAGAGQVLGAEIVVSSRPRGRVEVVYTEPKPEIDEGPFLAEERNLLDSVAAQLGLIVERRESAEAAARLQDQLRHADRLATLGMLTAGAAHELNEPLGAILGFTQLARETPGLPASAGEDLDRSMRATLRAREIIRKLMYFGRQAPQRHERVDLNGAVHEAIGFVESRARVQGVALDLALAEPAPAAMVDSGQLNQVLVNLLVNALQAMPSGGRLTVTTFGEAANADDAPGSAGRVGFAVEDTGVGMTDEVVREAFVPFFTTKDVGQGTGLGLSVVHGIVTAHGGTIDVTSTPGHGSRFTVRLPAARS